MNVTYRLSLSLIALLVVAVSGPVIARAGGYPEAAEKLLGTDPLVADTNGDGIKDTDQPKPLEMADPIAQGGNPGGFSITSAIVENNEDPVTHKAASDHIEIVMANTGGADIKGVATFITLKDVVTGATENYYRKLAGFKIARGASSTLHFEPKGSLDATAETDRFRFNPNSALYRTPNEKSVEIEVSVPGFAPAKIAIKKDKGRAEIAD